MKPFLFTLFILLSGLPQAEAGQSNFQKACLALNLDNAFFVEAGNPRNEMICELYGDESRYPISAFVYLNDACEKDGTERRATFSAISKSDYRGLHNKIAVYCSPSAY